MEFYIAFLEKYFPLAIEGERRKENIKNRMKRERKRGDF